MLGGGVGLVSSFMVNLFCVVLWARFLVCCVGCDV